MNNQLRQRVQQINLAKVVFYILVGYIFFSISYNYYQYGEYYNSTVKLFETNSGLLSVTGLTLLTAGVGLKLMTMIFFGELTLSEVHNCYETMWDVAIELFMMLALYPDIVSAKYFFPILFVTMSRYMHSILSQRVFLIERMPVVSLSRTTRLLALMVLMFAWDIKCLTFFMSGFLERTLADYLFFEQYTVMLTGVMQAFFQYVVLFQNNILAEPMVFKTTYITVIDTFFYTIRLITYIITCTLFFTESTIPMFVFFPLIKTASKIGRNINKLLKTWKLFKFLDKACVTISQEELTAIHDRTCIICRDHMDDARRLPCKHIFHSRCLLLWFQNGNACPICRSDIFEEYAALQKRNAQAAAVANALANQTGTNSMVASQQTNPNQPSQPNQIQLTNQSQPNLYQRPNQSQPNLIQQTNPIQFSQPTLVQNHNLSSNELMNNRSNAGTFAHTNLSSAPPQQPQIATSVSNFPSNQSNIQPNIQSMGGNPYTGAQTSQSSIQSIAGNSYTVPPTNQSAQHSVGNSYTVPPTNQSAQYSVGNSYTVPPTYQSAQQSVGNSYTVPPTNQSAQYSVGNSYTVPPTNQSAQHSLGNSYTVPQTSQSAQQSVGNSYTAHQTIQSSIPSTSVDTTLASEPYFQLLEADIPPNLINNNIPVFQYLPRNMQILIDSNLQQNDILNFNQVVSSLQIITDPKAFSILRNNKAAIEQVRNNLDAILDQMK